MTKMSEIPNLNIDELRPVVQRVLQLPEWPGDWNAAGLLFERYHITFESREIYPTGGRWYGALVIGDCATGNAHDADPLVALFRAFLLMHASQLQFNKIRTDTPRQPTA
jgi:hypothetical protein